MSAQPSQSSKSRKAENEFDLFLSHTHADKSIEADGKRVMAVQELKTALERHYYPKQTKKRPRRFRVCTYEEDLELDATVRESIISKLEASQALLVLCSTDASASEYVRFELETFPSLRPDHPIIAALWKCTPQEAFPERFRDDDLAANFAASSEMTLRDWRRQLTLESHKIVARVWNLPLQEVHDRFARAQRRRRISALAVVFAFVVVIAVAAFRINAARNRAEFERLISTLFTSATEDCPQLGDLLTKMERQRSRVIQRLSTEVLNDLNRQEMSTENGKKKAIAASVLVRLKAYEESLQYLKCPRESAETLSQFACHCKKLKVVDRDHLVEFLEVAHAQSLEPSLGSQRQMALACYAVLLALGKYDGNGLPHSLVEQLRKTYVEHPSAAVHSATGWLLRKYEHDVDTLDQELAIPSRVVSQLEWAGNDKEWFVVELKLPEGSSVQLTFVVFQPGEYRIGALRESNGRYPYLENPTEVQVTRTFALCDREVSLALYDAIMGVTGTPGDPRHLPVHKISQEGALDFCARLAPSFSGLEVSLPTEIEWEYACRNGTHTPYNFGADTGLLSCFASWGGKLKSPQRGGTRWPSTAGLFDMHGNVREWCENMYYNYEVDNHEVGNDKEKPRPVSRGGHFKEPEDSQRSHDRDTKTMNVGARIVLRHPDE